MKNVKVNVTKSVEQNLTHYIYKFINTSAETEIENYINGQDPIVEIIEKNSVHDTKSFVDYHLTKNDYPIGYSEYAEFTTPYEVMFPNSKIILNLKTDITSKAQEKIEISVSLHKLISKIVYKRLNENNEYEEYKVVNNVADIIETIIVMDYNKFLFRKEEVNYKYITADFSIQVIKYIDIHANGIFDPKVETVKGKDFTLFYQPKEKQHNYYEYRAISKDDKGILSPLSNIGAIELKEDPSTITQILEYTEKYKKDDESNWKVLTSSKANEEIIVNKEDLCSSIITTIKYYEISVDDSMIISDNVRYLKLPNIWHSSKRRMFYRENRTFRMRNKLNVYSNYSEPIFFNGHTEIYTDKMMVYKKNVTNLPQEERIKPLSPSDEDVELLKVYIRQGGIYYNEYNITGIDKDLENIVSVISLDSRYPLLSIKDSCLYSNTYNYTVYLYDERDNISEPTVVLY